MFHTLPINISTVGCMSLSLSEQQPLRQKQASPSAAALQETCRVPTLYIKSVVHSILVFIPDLFSPYVVIVLDMELALRLRAAKQIRAYNEKIRFTFQRRVSILPSDRSPSGD